MKKSAFFLLIFVFSIRSVSYAGWDGTLKSTVEINDLTVNGPVLADTDLFGNSISNLGDLNGDGVNDLAVGAFGTDDGGTNRGAIHIMFMNTDGSVDSTVEINDLTANGPVLTDTEQFGISISNLGDLNGDGVIDLAVGAYGNDDGGTNRGAIHIMYMNTDGSVDSTVEINDSTANGPVLADSDYFGFSMSNLGDLNGDGVIDLAVGAYGNDDGGSFRGAVHIMYMNTDGSVDSTVEINDLTANGPVLADNDYFGYSVSNIGDLNGDGVIDLAVGAYGNDDGGSASGAIHIMYMNTDGSVDSSVEINDSTANGPVLTVNDFFGYSILNLGDLNGDGVIDLAVGADGDDNGGSARGAIHVMFMNTDGSVDSTVEINDSTENGPVLADNDQLGVSSISLEDLNSDGVTDLAFGVYGDDGGTNRGAVHIIFLNPDLLAPTNTSSSLDTYTTSINNTISLSATSATEMMVSLSSTFSGASWETYSSTKSIALPDADAKYYVYSKFKDFAGNVTSTLINTIYLDRKSPKESIQIGTDTEDMFDINEDTLWIREEDIQEDQNNRYKIYFDTTDSTTEVEKIRVAYSEKDIKQKDWQDYDGDHNIKLPNSFVSGSKDKIKLYFQFKDLVGNTSNVYSQILKLQKQSPAIETINHVQSEDEPTQPQVSGYTNTPLNPQPQNNENTQTISEETISTNIILPTPQIVLDTTKNNKTSKKTLLDYIYDLILK